jgi:hypothetical protein
MRWRLWKSSARRTRHRQLSCELLEARQVLSTGLAALYGLKFSDSNRDGIWQPGEPTASGVEMRLYDSIGQLVASTSTDPTGRFFFQNLTPGRYTLAEAPGNPPPTTPLPLPLTLSAGEIAVARSGIGGIPGPDQVEVVLNELNVGNAGGPYTVERDRYTFSFGKVVLDDGQFRETVTLTGSGEVDALFEGAAEGDASDDNGNGLDEVAVQLAELQLSGPSSRGTVNVVLDPRQAAWGVIEEQANTLTGRLDVLPFAASGTATVTLDAVATIQVGTQTYDMATPLHLTATVTRKPVETGESYVSATAVALLDGAGLPAGIAVVSATWTPSPAHPWQNPRSPFDVDGNGTVSPRDVLVLINFLNTYGPMTLTPPQQPPLVPPPYLDVDGNGRVEPLDVLALINQINVGGTYAIPFDIVALPQAAPQSVIPPTASGEGEALATGSLSLAFTSTSTGALPSAGTRQSTDTASSTRQSLPTWQWDTEPVASRPTKPCRVRVSAPAVRDLEDTLGQIAADVAAAENRQA